MKNRILIVVVAVATIIGLLACSTGSLISRTQPTVTPTKTPKPTFTATSTPTNTPIPTDTPTPTSTATPTPEATNTPIILTATPTDTPPPTDTPEPTVPPTNTPRPTAKPTSKPRPQPTATKPAGPTNTPVPQFQYQGMIGGGFPNCGMTGVKGTIKTSSGSPVPGVTVAVWTDGWEGTVSNPSNSAGQWDVSHDTVAKAGTWYVQVVRAETCKRTADGNGYTAMGCEPLSNKVTVITTAHCSGEGAVQVPVVDFIKQY
ncbi:MAG: hypothetical protein JXA93_22195 [Anaerolineae bacterium]|nr:hypothetical protein [Anaerolineae bacterium]